MITLHNYSEYKSFIKLNSKGYEIISSSIDDIEDGTGGFCESGRLFGLYVYKSKLYFHYNNKGYETKSDEIVCTNKGLGRIKIDSKEKFMRNFNVKIRGDLICDITYIPYISPHALIFGDNVNEFDFLLYLSEIMESENSLNEFIKGIENLKKCGLNLRK